MAFRKLFPHPVFGILTDKIRVRDFVRDRLGESFLVPVYDITSDIESFSFESLPSSFVMKANHGCEWTELVSDKDSVDTELLRQKARRWLAQNFYDTHRERHYKSISPQIMFERLLTDRGQPPKDYKINCFRKNGILTQIVQVHSDRIANHKVNFFSHDWTPIRMDHGYPSAPCNELLRPDNLRQMLAAAEVLSEGFNFVRVDLYSVEGRIYFGEMTFTPGAGGLRFNPVEMDEMWGSLFEPDPSHFSRHRISNMSCIGVTSR
ncbi:ATP-grasp fold amidoligase family protein [Microvirga roseola]|uniref:ATP-grasp fold amidoligase family protein n=1 Tax=Microvirga roseola TaxID=2883126 RepID=UPI001E647918|nr:ATP-grasp fold amidoligase family protein [Microvirga roseola]